MHEFENEYNDDVLRRRLRREARRSRPVFSEALHARLLSAVVPRGGHLRVASDARGGRAWPRDLVSWTLAAAASIAATVALALFLRASPTLTADSVALNAPSAPGKGDSRQGPGEAPLPETPANGGSTNDSGNDIDSVAEDLARSASGIGDWMLSVADDSQWAGLDRDARAALAAVAGPLPFDLTFSLAEE